MDVLTELTAESSVLDIGPGSGAIGAYLKQDLGVTQLSAVEIDPETIEMLREQEIYSEIKTDVSELSVQQFDCILLMDLLEHLPDPFSFLQEIQTLLKPGGIICVSVPNIAHWSIRFSLLLGFFEYTERGILDKTHLQFFNFRRFRYLCSRASSCSLEQTAPSLEPVEFVLPSWITGFFFFKALRQCQLRIAHLVPGLFAYQHLGLLRKSN